MVSQKNLNVSIVLVVSICCALFCPSLSGAQDVTLSVSDGIGVRGSSCCNPNYPDGNRVEVILDNPADKVGYISLDICSPDMGDSLEFSGSEVTPRAEAVDHSITYNAGNRCVEVLFSYTAQGSVFIDTLEPQESGTVAILNFNVSENAPSGNCPAGGDLTMSAVFVNDELFNPLSVAEDPGKFCYFNCGSDTHCDDGLFCNGEEQCIAGSCQPFLLGPPCPPLLCNEADDRCYCNANGQCDDENSCTVDTCIMGPGKCQNTNPCDDSDPCTDDCDEGSGCQQVCTADGPWDACCGSSSFCGGEPVCNEEVTLTVANGSGLPSSTGNEVVIRLNNPSDPVSLVSVHICDEGNNLTLPSGSCVLSGRAAGYECNCTEQLIGSAAGCVSCGVLDPTGDLPPISPGSGPLFTLSYDVSSGAGVCKDHYILTEEPFTVDVRDVSNQPLRTMPEDGQFCIFCNNDTDCDDGNVCTNDSCGGGISCSYTNIWGSTPACNDGDPCTDDQCQSPNFGTKHQCVGIDSLPYQDDGLYCNGVESCGGGTPNPCASCDEDNDVCVPSSDVTLTIENAYGRESVITIALENSDEVGEVHLEVFDADQRDWLHISAVSCSNADRTAGFNCITTDLGPGRVGVDIISNFPLDFIPTGAGAIAYLTYTVDPVTIPMENYADLDPQATDVKDRDAFNLSVTPKPGRLYAHDYCHGDFVAPIGAVDGGDVGVFLDNFGRSPYMARPCTDEDYCFGDFDCDAKVDGGDIGVFLENFGRSPYMTRPCPPPAEQFVCSYE